MTRLMLDAVNYKNLVGISADLYAGYVNGSVSQWPTGGWQAFASEKLVRIDVDGTDFTADVLDVEQGNSTDSAGFPVVIEWVKKHVGDYLPILYANRATLTPMFNALYAQGLKVETHFRLGIATLDGTKTVKDMTGVTYVQYTDHSNLYDESVVYDDAWKKVAPPVVVTPPKPPAILYGALVRNGSEYPTYTAVSSSDDGVTWR